MNLYRRGRRFEKKKKKIGDWVETKKADILGAQIIIQSIKWLSQAKLDVLKNLDCKIK